MVPEPGKPDIVQDMWYERGVKRRQNRLCSIAPPCVNAVAFLTEDCSYSGGTCAAGKIYFNGFCFIESDIDCDPGEYFSPDGYCADCQPGRFHDSGSGMSCKTCDADAVQYQNEAGQSSCKKLVVIMKNLHQTEQTAKGHNVVMVHI